ncbi:MAG: hypothetical protein CMJ78_16975 [Planctomycetaceae bacterium]|nr:hypothetical protein [Planctomycetaceae bacterium]
MDCVLNRLQVEMRNDGRLSHFNALKVFLRPSGTDGASIPEIAQQLSLSLGAVHVAVHRLRKRFAELMRLEILRTVESPDDVDEEIQRLFESLG